MGRDDVGELRQAGVLADGGGRAFTVMGDRVIVKAAASGQPHTLFEVVTRGPFGPPPHRQSWPETYYVLEGALDVLLDGEWRTASVGDTVHVPADVTRAHRAHEAKRCRFLVFAANGEIAELFRALDEEPSVAAPDVTAVGLAAAGFGVRPPKA
jgi:mannose-6-phosphate isomerase-like protein (cupin superfamily)